jgi:hypothetical protein
VRRESIFGQLELHALLIGQVWRDVGGKERVQEERRPATLAADVAEVLITALFGSVRGHRQPIRVISGSSTGAIA